MGTTLELGPRSVEVSDNGSTEADSDDESCDVDMSKADDEPFRCSQREGGDSWGLCYQDFNRMERLEKTVVPVEILYSWWVDGEVSKDEYLGTFTEVDVQCPGCCLNSASFDSPSKLQPFGQFSKPKNFPKKTVASMDVFYNRCSATK